MRHLQLFFRAYRERYNLAALDAYRLARYAMARGLTIHGAWFHYDRGEVPGTTRAAAVEVWRAHAIERREA